MRATFAQMNLFRPALEEAFFDVVISNGVLHHTADAARPSGAIARWFKPGGYVVVGLYNTYSRTPSRRAARARSLDRPYDR